MVYIINAMEFDLADTHNEKHPHPTLKQVQTKMKGFDESLILYTYHKLNGREEEAASYLAEWEEEQEAIRNELKPTTEFSQENIKVENERISGEHFASEPDNHIKE